MKVSVYYYAAAKELAGCDSSTFEFTPPSIPQAELRSAVIDRFPSLTEFLERMRLAVNGDFVDASQPLQDGDRVDVLPPVAGGSPVVLCRISDQEISLDEVRKAVEHPGAGGVCIFHGVVRDHADGRQVDRLDYEAHESLAEKEMNRVLDGVIAEHPGVRVAAVHRVGREDVEHEQDHVVEQHGLHELVEVGRLLVCSPAGDELLEPRRSRQLQREE